MATIGIACGGTGGHLYPGLAVAEKLAESGHQIRIYISNKEIDKTVMRQYPQYEHVALPTIGWPGLSPKVVSFCIKFHQAYGVCVKEIREHKLSAVLGMGGFTSAPLLICAARRGIPVLLHESNSIPGKVTRMLATQSNKVLLGFKECAQYLGKNDCRVTGTPIRQNLIRISRAEAAAYWNFDSEKVTITVIGGSQGASGLNQVVTRCLPHFKKWKDHIQVIHQTGLREVELVEGQYKSSGVPARVMAFCERMEMIYSISDIMVARSGAASLTEINHFGLPSILVPYPHAAENHQVSNALIIENAGAARMIQEGSDVEAEFISQIEKWIQNPLERQAVSSKSMGLAQFGAAECVAREVRDVL
jgi:UDP-N-acetylglucosamine--N-acetylmuramyl-(pentapeptide) pyrophosphoryl-undecaprenol N-acetylglucosamine transferase